MKRTVGSKNDVLNVKIPKELYHQILDVYMASEEMRSFLYNKEISIDNLCQMISSAPISIETKIDTLKSLMGFSDYNGILVAINRFEEGIRALSLSENEYFILREVRYCYGAYEFSGQDSWRELIYYSIEDVMNDIKNIISRGKEDQNLKYYNILEKRTEKNDRKVVYSYCLIGDKIIDVARDRSISVWTDAYHSTVNPPNPYKIGDIVTIDCRPFMPIRHGVMLSSYHKGKINETRILIRDEKGIWRTLSTVDLIIWPLYRIKKNNDELKDGEKLLVTVGRYLGKDQKKWEKLIWNSNLWDYESVGIELSDVKDEDLLEYFVEQGLEMTENEQELLDKYAVLMTYQVEKKIRYGELYDIGIDSQMFPAQETFVEKIIEEKKRHFINDINRKSFIIRNKSNKEWDLISVHEKNGSHWLNTYHQCSQFNKQQVHCIDMKYMYGFPVMLCRVESETIPPHLQVFIGGHRYYCSSPTQLKSIEGAHLIVEENELYVEIDKKKIHYETTFINEMLYFNGVPKGYEWIREMTNIYIESVEGREKIKNWVT